MSYSFLWVQTRSFHPKRYKLKQTNSIKDELICLSLYRNCSARLEWFAIVPATSANEIMGGFKIQALSKRFHVGEQRM